MLKLEVRLSTHDLYLSHNMGKGVLLITSLASNARGPVRPAVLAILSEMFAP